MKAQVKADYRHLRAKGWQAKLALRAVKVKDQFKTMESDGLVRLRVEPDQHADMDDMKGDSFNPRVNSEIPRSKLKREEKAFEEQVQREGVWGVIGEYFNGRTWEHADSCWGFVGWGWLESGYDEDIMRATMNKVEQIQDWIEAGEEMAAMA